MALARPIIVGTAGHIDHGKTVLIRALTGVDTDRLPEEKKRGISIDLGFASFRLPSGRLAGVVDVPGHERFVHNMLAGVHGMDVVLLVVAADDGVMPQTREHLHILDLAGVRNGIIVVTKIDLVDAVWLEMVEEDIRQAVAGTVFADAPMVRVSAFTGEGLDSLVATIDEVASRVGERDASGLVRLPVDRVFTIPGFGTVVTGTLVSGTIRPGDHLTILPRDQRVRVRQVEVDGPVPAAVAGQRVGVSLVGVEKEDVSRGDVLTEPGAIVPTMAFEGRLVLLADAPRPLHHNDRVHLHTGTAEVLGRVLLREGELLAPGQSGYIRFQSESPLVLIPQDRFVVRSYSPVTTIGGGVVIDPHPRGRIRSRPVSELQVLEAATDVQRAVESLLRPVQGQLVPQLPGEVAQMTGLSPAQAANALEEAAGQGKEVIKLPGGYFLHRRVLETWAEKLTQHLQQYYQKNPLRRGPTTEELRTGLWRGLEPRRFQPLISALTATGKFTLSNDVVSLPDHVVALSPEQQEIVARLEQALRDGGFAPPGPAELATLLAVPVPVVRELLDYLCEENRVVKVSEDLYLPSTAMAEARRRLGEFFASRSTMTAAELRDLLGTTRKYALPIAGYLDTAGFTRRVGDVRVAGPALANKS